MKRHFSLITATPGQERAAAQDWAASAYAEHQWLWRFFLSPPGTPRDFLFRRSDVAGMPRFYVVSKRAPVAYSPHWQVQTRDYEPRLAAGQRLAFELRANPVVAGQNAQGGAARHDVVMQERKRLLAERGLARWQDWQGDDRPPLHDVVYQTCAHWLASRCQRLGIELVNDALRADGYQQHRGKRGEIQFSSVDFAGELTVAEPEALCAALAQGVGHAKAFGCGLLLVRPVG
jgi:CRISPR system Cascade subunit CasE